VFRLDIVKINIMQQTYQIL